MRSFIVTIPEGRHVVIAGWDIKKAKSKHALAVLTPRDDIMNQGSSITVERK